MRDHSPVTVRLVYLARLRDAFGASGETYTLETGEVTVGKLLESLRSRGGTFADELGGERTIRVAVNHALAQADAVIRDGDEVAILPPVTGG